MSSVTEKFIYQVYIEVCKEERLKTFAWLRFDLISLALKLSQTSSWLKRVALPPPLPPKIL